MKLPIQPPIQPMLAQVIHGILESGPAQVAPGVGVDTPEPMIGSAGRLMEHSQQLGFIADKNIVSHRL